MTRWPRLSASAQAEEAFRSSKEGGIRIALTKNSRTVSDCYKHPTSVKWTEWRWVRGQGEAVD